MKLLFVADPLHTFKTYKDSTFAMMREAASRGHELWACEPQDIVWQRGGQVQAQSRRISLTGDEHDWFEEVEAAEVTLASMDAVLMRKDPPFDAEYLYTTHLLTQAEREGAKAFNKPQALREHPEKNSPSWSSRSTSHPRWSRAASRPCGPFTPHTRTSSSSLWMAWAAWASSA